MAKPTNWLSTLKMEEHGAGDFGTSEVTKKYKSETPGESVKESEDQMVTGFEVYDRFDDCVYTARTQAEANAFVDDDHQMDIVKTKVRKDAFTMKEAFGQSGIDINTLAQKIGVKKPSVRNNPAGGGLSYLFKGILADIFRQKLETVGYPEIQSYEYGDGFVTDHKKDSVVIRVGPAEQGRSTWLTVTSDLKEAFGPTKFKEGMLVIPSAGIWYKRPCRIVSLYEDVSEALIENIYGHSIKVATQDLTQMTRHQYEQWKSVLPLNWKFLDLSEAKDKEPEKNPKQKYVILVTCTNPNDKDVKKRNEVLFKKYTISATSAGSATTLARDKATDAGLIVKSAKYDSIAPAETNESTKIINRIEPMKTLTEIRQILAEDKPIIVEKLSASAPASEWISDFVNSSDSRFAGKSKEERRKMALAAYYAAQKNK